MSGATKQERIGRGGRRRATLAALLLALLPGCFSLFGGRKAPDCEEITAKGFELLEKGSFSHAMGSFNDALDIDPRYAPAHYGLGRVFIATGYLDGAQKEFQAAAALDSTYGEAYLGLGRLHYDMGEMEKAEEEILLAKKYGAGETAQGLYMLGLLSERRKAAWEAETYFRKSLDKEPGNTDVRLALVDLLRSRSRYEDALAELEREDFPRAARNSARLRFADCRLHLGQDLEAERLYREVVSHDRRSAEGRWGLALLALRRKDYEEAADQLGRYAVLLTGDDGRLFHDLAAKLASPDGPFTFADRLREMAVGDDAAVAGRAAKLLAAMGEEAE